MLGRPAANRSSDAAFWERLPELDLSAMDPQHRAWNAQRWAQCARMEHASVASFSKFSLQLMALGAPPELLTQCHQAALDEIQHARISFALASRLQGSPLGPGPLPLQGDVIGELSLLRVCEETAVDGCIEESLAAAEAHAAGSEARDPAIVAALAIIERDEARHAELAWGVVGWALSFGDPAVATGVRRAFEVALDGVQAAAECGDPRGEEGYGGHGQLPTSQRLRVRARTAQEVLRPAVEELFATAGDAGGG